MRLYVLGPLELRTDAGEVRRPKGGKQRLLLASLLLHAPRVVSVDRLIDLLWGDRLPENPTASLRTQASRLRTLLGEAGAEGDFLVSEPYGYRLAVGREVVDAGRFEATLRSAREASEPERALALLDEALSLWRGDPFEEFSGLPHFLGESTRFRELHAGAHERRIECLLALGRTSEALGAVEPLIQEDPLRERPRALCMEALYGAGRPHEALAVFQEYRRLLSQELGLDPSPSLRALEGAILRHEHAPAMRVLPMAEPDAGAHGAVRAEPAAATPSRQRSTPDAPGVAGNGGEARSPARRASPPQPLTRLIGRESEQARVLRLLESTRLLTLTGAGGNGKTRLAIEVAARARDAFTDGVAWVGFESLADPDLVPQEVAAAVGTPEHPDRSATDALVRVLRERGMLLVLDNCEHLIGACASLAHALLRACPDLMILATSREPLGITGEVIWSVPPLAPARKDVVDLAGVRRSPAVELFVERAQAVHPRFQLTEANAPDVAQICRRLDGVPLALELAAARMRTLSPRQIAAALDRRFALLTAGSRTSLPRHQTLRAAVDWSYDLLTGPERWLLERLSVFAGSFDLNAVEAVSATGAGTPEAPTLDLLSSLVQKSLVTAEPEPGAARFRLLETVRHYARARLGEHGAEREVCRRHTEYYAELAETAGPLLLSPHRVAWARRLSSEQDNLRAALAWALGEEGGGVYALRLAGSLWWFWHYVGRLGEGRRWIEHALALPEAAGSVGGVGAVGGADAVGAAGSRPAAGSRQAADPAEVRPTTRRSEPDPVDATGADPHRATLLYAAAKSNWMLGDPAAALPFAEEGVRLCRRLGAGRLLVRACTARALVLREHGDLVEAERSADEGLDVARRSGGDPGDVALALWTRGCVRMAAGDLERASGEFRRAIALWEESGDDWGLAEALRCQAVSELEQGRLDDALRSSRRSIATLRDADETWFLCHGLETLAAILSRARNPASAARLLGAAAALRESIRAPVLGYEQREHERTVEATRSALGDAAFTADWDRGRALGLPEAVQLALDACDGVGLGPGAD